MTILNYNHIKEDYTPYLNNWLGLASNSLKNPELAKINRSISFEESYCLSKITDVLNKEIGDISFQWISKIPDIKVDKEYPSEEVQLAIWEKWNQIS